MAISDEQAILLAKALEEGGTSDADLQLILENKIFWPHAARALKPLCERIRGFAMGALNQEGEGSDEFDYTYMRRAQARLTEWGLSTDQKLVRYLAALIFLVEKKQVMRPTVVEIAKLLNLTKQAVARALQDCNVTHDQMVKRLLT